MYQEYATKALEKQWLEGIKLRHPVKQYKETLKDAFGTPQASTQ